MNPLGEIPEVQEQYRRLEQEEIFFLTYRWLRRVFTLEVCILVISALLWTVITIHLIDDLTRH